MWIWSGRYNELWNFRSVITNSVSEVMLIWWNFHKSCSAYVCTVHVNRNNRKRFRKSHWCFLLLIRYYRKIVMTNIWIKYCYHFLFIISCNLWGWYASNKSNCIKKSITCSIPLVYETAFQWEFLKNFHQLIYRVCKEISAEK